MAMALVDRRCAPGNSARRVDAPAQDEEFVLYHSDNVQATGFVST
jgi:alpha-D-ribose 1-methylphosphonate 5-triphosphate synthase subunit PhnI